MTPADRLAEIRARAEAATVAIRTLEGYREALDSAYRAGEGIHAVDPFAQSARDEALKWKARMPAALAALRHAREDVPCNGPDWTELADHLHVIQRAIGSQIAARVYPDQLRPLGRPS